ncbi:MAG TPA: phosphotransferase [Candidatus Ornithoclostridium excrementipullorum]|nr:phosphotransferase [Candidatus Ornithoclostridium excrementipullorum]
MKTERIQQISVDKKTGAVYAARAAESMLGVKPSSVGYLGGGSFGRAFGIKYAGGEAVIKLLADPGMMSKETFDLTLLGDACPVPMPKVLFAREPDESVPVACYGMEKIEGGCALTSLRLWLSSKKKKAAFADAVTSALHTIHSRTADKFGDSRDPAYDTWLGFYRPFAEQVLNAARKDEIFSDGIISVMDGAMEKFDTVFEEEIDRACLIHGDLNIANIMVKGSRLTGFIDPLNSMYADREYDLFQFDNIGGRHFGLSAAYREKYGASRRFAEKLAFYGLWNEVWCSIKVGHVINFIMDPLVKNMRSILSRL